MTAFEGSYQSNASGAGSGKSGRKRKERDPNLQVKHERTWGEQKSLSRFFFGESSSPLFWIT